MPEMDGYEATRQIRMLEGRASATARATEPQLAGGRLPEAEAARGRGTGASAMGHVSQADVRGPSGPAAFAVPHPRPPPASRPQPARNDNSCSISSPGTPEGSAFIVALTASALMHERHLCTEVSKEPVSTWSLFASGKSWCVTHSCRVLSQVGMDHFLTKPVRLVDLEALLMQRAELLLNKEELE